MYRGRRWLLPILLLSLWGAPVLADRLSPHQSSQSESRLKDPTAPPRTLVAGASAKRSPAALRLRLDSLIIGPERRLAVINGIAVAEGDRLAGARVLQITRGGVRVQRAGKISRLRLAELPDIRRSAPSPADPRTDFMSERK